MELNNKLIEETYFLSKKREYVQLHLEDSDLSILNIGGENNNNNNNDSSNPTINNIYGNAINKDSNTNLFGKIKLNNFGDNDKEEDNQEEIITNIDIHLITNNQRLSVTIPNYNNHYRLYFENPDGFA